jgi:hypothetical protein
MSLQSRVLHRKDFGESVSAGKNGGLVTFSSCVDSAASPERGQDPPRSVKSCVDDQGFVGAFAVGSALSAPALLGNTCEKAYPTTASLVAISVPANRSWCHTVAGA